MDQAFIVAFIKSTRNIFSTMLQLDVEVGKPELSHTDQCSFDVSAIIGMSGDINGAVVLSFPRETARRVVSIMCGADVGDNADDLSDAVGEMVNMITGGAKAQLDGKSVSISCPTVVIGSQHTVYGAKDVTRVMIPCTCDCGEFSVEVSLRPGAAGVQGATTPASANAA